VNDSAGPLTVGGLREISIRSSSWLIPARCSGHFNHDAVQGGRAWLETLQLLFSVTRFPLHGCQRVEAYAAYMAPSSYITNAATFATADLLRRVSLVAYRTAELGLAWPAQGFGAGDRPLWQARPDSERRARWSAVLARYAVTDRPANAAVLERPGAARR